MSLRPSKMRSHPVQSCHPIALNPARDLIGAAAEVRLRPSGYGVTDFA